MQSQRPTTWLSGTMDPNQHEVAHSGNALSHRPVDTGSNRTQRWVEDKKARGARAMFLSLGLLMTAIHVVAHFPRAPVLWLILIAPMALPFVIYYFHVRTRLFSVAVGAALLPAVWLLLTPIGFLAILLNFAVVGSGAFTQEVVLGRLARRRGLPSFAPTPEGSDGAVTKPTSTDEPRA